MPPVSVLNKMFPDLPQKTAETLTQIGYESLKEESRQALEDRHLALNNSAAARKTTVISIMTKRSALKKVEFFT